MKCEILFNYGKHIARCKNELLKYVTDYIRFDYIRDDTVCECMSCDIESMNKLKGRTMR